MARVAYLEKEQTEPVLREVLEKIEQNGNLVLNLYKTLAHSPYLARDFIRFGNKLLFKGVLDPKLRELAILQVGHLTGATYEHTKHVEIALQVGVPRAQVDAVGQWAESGEFDGREKAVLRYAAEMTQQVRASDEAFAALKEFFDEKTIVELTITVGFYNMVSRILESLGVELEEDSGQAF